MITEKGIIRLEDRMTGITPDTSSKLIFWTEDGLLRYSMPASMLIRLHDAYLYTLQKQGKDYEQHLEEIWPTKEDT